MKAAAKYLALISISCGRLPAPTPLATEAQSASMAGDAATTAKSVPDRTVAVVNGDAVAEQAADVLTSGPIYQIALRLQPSDMTSDMATTPLRVWINNDGSPIPQSAMDEVVAAVALHRVDGTAIAFKTKTYSPPPYVPAKSVDKSDDASSSAPPPSDTPPDPLGYVEVIPNTPLTNGWYELSLTRIPDGCVVAAPDLHEAKPAFGVVGVRFSPSSAPVLVSAYTCSKKGGARVAGVKVSEPVNLQFGKFVQMGVGNALCLPTEVTGVVSPGLDFSQCPTDIVAPWHVTLQPGMKALSGASVQIWPTTPNGDILVDFSKLPDISSCRTVRW